MRLSNQGTESQYFSVKTSKSVRLKLAPIPKLPTLEPCDSGHLSNFSSESEPVDPGLSFIRKTILKFDDVVS